MKPALLLVTLAAATAQVAEGKVIYYWCAKSKCDNAKGVGPTYECGKRAGFGHYDSGRKKWREFGVKPGEPFWEVGGFLDCCHWSGKTACYDISGA
ncbi:hypothetical protein BT67DRAFT_41108 [Trichocladium antarcticum]|uniref:Uncharacterized protein n=1 Tax=Trichocladium antarcticum TaxID=1450529 RepID=A0AAN6ZC78_9PEZI|nr:hypothetical protein BT67DRAFT_41108 [Trichocladium antarcticum]